MSLLARRKMRGQILKSCWRLLLPTAVFCLGIVMTAPAALCLCYGTETVLSNAGLSHLAGRYANAAIPVALFAAGAVLFLFSSAFSFYAKAWVYYAMDRNQTRPGSLLRPSQALRYLRCRAGRTLREAGWLALYLSPAAALFFALRSGKGGALLTAPVFAVTAAADVLFAVVGAAFFAVASSQYYMTDYLLYLNPLMPPKEAIASSVKLTKGRLLAVTARRLSLLPWALTELMVLPLPFAAVYRRFCAAALCERLFGEDKRRVPGAAVVFYVNRRSRMREADGGRP